MHGPLNVKFVMGSVANKLKGTWKIDTVVFTVVQWKDSENSWKTSGQPFFGRDLPNVNQECCRCYGDFQNYPSVHPNTPRNTRHFSSAADKPACICSKNLPNVLVSRETVDGTHLACVLKCSPVTASLPADEEQKKPICGNKMPTRCNRGFYCRSYCWLNMFRASLCPSSGAQEYYTVVAACGISCCGFSSSWSGVELRVMCPVCSKPASCKRDA